MMVWFGYDIMDGDTPLQCERDLKDYLVGKERLAELAEKEAAGEIDDLHRAVETEAYEALQFPVNSTAAMLAIQDSELCTYAPNIAMQVLGKMIMHGQQPFPENIRNSVIVVSQREIEDGWSNTQMNHVREVCLLDFIDRVRQYPVSSNMGKLTKCVKID